MMKMMMMMIQINLKIINTINNKSITNSNHINNNRLAVIQIKFKNDEKFIDFN